MEKVKRKCQRWIDAVKFFTGNEYTPAFDATWDRLIEALDSISATPEEYCFWLIHVKENSFGPMVLKFKNKIINIETLSQFEEYSSTRDKKVESLVKFQTERFRIMAECMGDKHLALMSEATNINPIMRIDIALMLYESEGFDPKPIIEAFKENALYMNKGCPHYRKYCWFFNRWLDTLFTEGE